MSTFGAICNNNNNNNEMRAERLIYDIIGSDDIIGRFLVCRRKPKTLEETYNVGVIHPLMTEPRTSEAAGAHVTTAPLRHPSFSMMDFK